VIEAYKSGKFGGRDKVAKHYNISSATIWNWISKDRKQGTLENDIYHKRGRTKESNLTKEDWKERYEILKNTRPSSRHNERKSNIYKFI
jgi:transposase